MTTIPVILYWILRLKDDMDVQKQYIHYGINSLQ